MNDIPILTIPTLAIAGSDHRFPVRRIFCVGQNYAEHARENGSDPQRQRPFFFTKPADAPSMIFGHAVGIDLTRRDLQAEAKKTGRPWDMAKGFDHRRPSGR